jgi:phosphoserine phosphatase
MIRVIETLKQALDEGPGVVAFDADGTLWSGDVGEDFFLFCTERSALKDAASPALQELAQRFELPVSAEPNAQARLLFEAFADGRLPEREACEMMAWALAGYAEDELSMLVSDALASAELEGRRHRQMQEAIRWARDNSLPTVVISASPSFVIEVATAPVGFQASEIAACRPASLGGVLEPRLAEPLPYAEQKVHAATRLSPDLPLLAAFGDNSFDLPMLEAARVGVAVHPKPALSRLIAGRTDLLVVDS